MNEEAQALIQWFTSQELPTGHFQISNWESTENLANTVELAIGNIWNGNTNSLAVLKRVKEQLDSAK